jgi:hypothetical protein
MDLAAYFAAEHSAADLSLMWRWQSWQGERLAQIVTEGFPLALASSGKRLLAHVDQ